MRYGHVTNVTWAPSKMRVAISIAQSVRSTRTCRFLVQTFLRNADRVLLFRLQLQAVGPTPRVSVMQASLETDKLAAPFAHLAHTTTRQTCKIANLVRATRPLWLEAL